MIETAKEVLNKVRRSKNLAASWARSCSGGWSPGALQRIFTYFPLFPRVSRFKSNPGINEGPYHVSNNKSRMLALGIAIRDPKVQY